MHVCVTFEVRMTTNIVIDKGVEKELKLKEKL